MEAIAVHDLVKTYGTKKETVKALDEISFSTQQGEIFGVIGPDGAGKTSLFRILTTMLLPDSGTASVDGFDVVKDMQQIRNRVGYMPGKFSLYQDLTVEENLEFFASIFNTSIAENYNLVKDIYVQIEPFRKRRAGKLSGGMKQKLALCCALIHKPSVLFLDEPTTGVDVVSRKEFWDMLKGLKQQGISMLVSTPYMDEAAMCDRVALMQSGRIMTINTPQQVIDRFGKPLWAVRSENMYRLLLDLKQYENTWSCHSFGAYHHLVLKDDATIETAVLEYLVTKGHQQTAIKRIVPNIEDCFMQLMNDNVQS